MFDVSEAVRRFDWYPPSCKEDVERLVDFCESEGAEELAAVFGDINYRVVYDGGESKVHGSKFKTHRPEDDEFEFIITDSESDFGRKKLRLGDVKSIERIGGIPSKYQV